MKLSTMKQVKARQIYDSRSNPTVEVDITLENGMMGRGIVPAGASTDKFEAIELRDSGERYDGKGVTKAIENINKIIGPALVGMNVTINKLLIVRR